MLKNQRANHHHLPMICLLRQKQSFTVCENNNCRFFSLFRTHLPMTVSIKHIVFIIAIFVYINTEFTLTISTQIY